MRTVLVYNQQSSGYGKVLWDIVDPVKNMVKGELVEYSLESGVESFGKNVNNIAKIIQENDLVIVAGGDGTASIVANAVLQKNAKGVRLAVFGYGNFNDFQSNFGLKKRDLKRIINGKAEKITVRPIEVSLNGKFWRFATLYFTAGLLAKSTKVFEIPKIRRAISRKSKIPRLFYSLFMLAMWFCHEVHRKRRRNFFKVNGSKETVTDFGAMNGRRMARVLRNNKCRFDSGKLNVFSLKLSNIIGAGFFVLRSMTIGVKTKPEDEAVWDLGKDTKLWLQTEGEGMEKSEIYSIQAKKSEKTIDFVV